MIRRINLVSIVIAFIIMASHYVFADGKLLIFSTPPESEVTAEQDLSLERPQLLVSPTVPDYLLKKQNEKSDSGATTLIDALPENLKDRANFNVAVERSYFFPVPPPVSNISDFGFQTNLAFWDYARLYMKYAQNRSGQTLDQAQNEQSALDFDEALWREVYSGNDECDNPQLALSLKTSVQALVNGELEEPIRDKAVYIPSSAGDQGKGFFNVPETRVIIAWNGKEDRNGIETMIVSPDISCAYRSKATALSIIPLPSKPIRIERANSRAFYDAKLLFNERTPEPKITVVDPGVKTATRIGAHNIFVLNVDNTRDFYEKVTNYISYKYRGCAFPFIDSETLRVIEFYIQRGVRYFAFDLIEIDSNTEKETIAYTFNSQRLYYPLVINRVGGKDDYSTLDLIVITPGAIRATADSAIQKLLLPDRPAFAKNAATLARMKNAKFSIDEVRKIDENLDVFDTNTAKLSVSNIKFKKRYNIFTNDLLFCNHVSSKYGDGKQSPQVANIINDCDTIDNTAIVSNNAPNAIQSSQQAPEPNASCESPIDETFDVDKTIESDTEPEKAASEDDPPISEEELAPMNEEAPKVMPPEKGKIYMLTVWSGSAVNYKDGEIIDDQVFMDCVNASHGMFEGALSVIGLDVTNKKLIPEYISLTGENTTPQKIMDAICDLSQKAGEGDALFVYIMSHGCALDSIYVNEGSNGYDLDNASEREHVLLPLIKTPKIDVEKDVISRADLLYSMRSKKHRLNVLITDAGFETLDKSLDKIRVMPNISSVSDRRLFVLRYLLTHASGTYSWNSSCPSYSYRVPDIKELLKDYSFRVPTLSDVKPRRSVYGERSFLLSHCGSIFNLAFILAAGKVIRDPEYDYSFDDFFQDLGSANDLLYERFIGCINAFEHDNVTNIIHNQAFTSLTSFNVDDNLVDETKESCEVVSKNNVVEHVYEHNNSNKGSGKTGGAVFVTSFVFNLMD